ncbi:phage tail protein [Derxia gummosa]|uniref:Phage tail protein n=1 Tax=Derxia gummosa DSM 723 TaxID=1121388 RepID=A0A8B6X1Z8_9BURK|nr:phage tail protein [Derxia gummosa]
MDANGSRHFALVTQGDWQGALDAAFEGLPPGDRPLAWSDGTTGGGAIGASCGAGGLGLKGLLHEFRPRGEVAGALAEGHGRGGAFDAWGNLYSLSADRRAIRIRSAGSGAMSDFWPVTGEQPGAPQRDGIAAIAGLTAGRRAPAPGSTAAGGFRPVAATPAPAAVTLDALAVTRGHYLVVAAAAAGGLLIFDLHGAGPPLFQGWPGLGRVPGEAGGSGGGSSGNSGGGSGAGGGSGSGAPRITEALVALEDGGIGALIDGRLWRVGADLKPALPATAGAPAFGPVPKPGAGDATPAAPDAEDGSPPASPPVPSGGNGGSAKAAAPQPCVLDLRPALFANLAATGAPPGTPVPPDALATVRVTAVAALRGERLLVIGRRVIDGAEQPVAGAMHLDGSVLPVLRRDLAGAVPADPLDALIAEVVEPRDIPLPDGGSAQQRPRPALAERALAIDHGANAVDAAAPFAFIVVAAGGDQAFRFAADWRDDGALAIGIVRDFLPMRRYLGLGLAALPGGVVLHAYPAARVFYAADERWVPLLALPQPRYLRDASLELPPWDSRLPGCVWHRVALDMRLPPGTTLAIETRADDDPASLPHQPWRREPGPARNPAGSELPWRDSGTCAGEGGGNSAGNGAPATGSAASATGAPISAMTACGSDDASGTWSTLLQAATGRFLQLRLVIGGDGKRTPLLRALRAWYPRFSYAREYLPPVYRADPTGADFLDRFLALFEGEFTRWEDRIAAAQLLLDARTAPAGALDWLAGWVGVALDPALDDRRRRLLIRHAMTRHARRGTVPGLLLGATLAWETSIDEAWFDAPETLAERPHGLRLQELSGLVPPLPASAWNPATQGRADLLARLDGDATLADPQALAALGAADGSGTTGNGASTPADGAADAADAGSAAAQDNATTTNATRHATLLRALGFTPRGAIEEARLWSAWSEAQAAQARAATLAGDAPLAGDDGASADSPAPLPADEPATAADRAAWTTYLAASAPCAPLRRRWQDFLSRRWRRVSALNAAWGTRWRDFDRIPSPVALPASAEALADWHRFESRVLRGLAGAHRFRVVLPLPDAGLDLDDLARRRDAVLRVIADEKPAHTVAEVRFGFDLFRIGEARLGLDTRLETGLARRPELAALGWGGGAVAPAVLGRIDLGGARLAPLRPQPPADRVGLDRG